jgi:hypothetical protein
MSRLWFQKAFVNSVKTAGRAKGIGSQAFAKFPVTHRLRRRRRRLAVVSCQQEAQSQRGGGLLSLGQLAPIRDPPLPLDLSASQRITASLR